LGRGGKRKIKRKSPTNHPWIKHVKEFARAHGMEYGQALKAAKASYRKGGLSTGGLRVAKRNYYSWRKPS
jgi:hypothetical protein